MSNSVFATTLIAWFAVELAFALTSLPPVWSSAMIPTAL